MPGREQGKLSAVYQTAKVFHDHAAEYDNWFASSLVYEIELAALRSLKSIIFPPEIEIGVGPGRFARDLGIEGIWIWGGKGLGLKSSRRLCGSVEPVTV